MKSLSKMVLFSQVSLLCTVIFVISALWFHEKFYEFRMENQKIRTEYISQQKKLIKKEVENAVDYIYFKKSQTEERVRGILKERIYEVHAIAKNIYENHKDRLNEAEITKLIYIALDKMRYNNDRGYYFINKGDELGTEILCAKCKPLENKSIIDWRDKHGNYVIKDMIEIVNTVGEGFYTYYWTKSGDDPKAYPKLAFVKLFEPYGWFIGTGEYLDDMEADIQKEVLERLRKIRFGDDGYIFVVSYDGITLMNDFNQEIIGKNMLDSKNRRITDIYHMERQAVENPDGGYINYSWPKPSTSTLSPKISFIKGIPEWRWMIGAGVYTDALEDILGQRTSELRRKIYFSTAKIAALLTFLIIAVVFIAKTTTNKLQSNFEVFNSFFRSSALKSEKITASDLNFSEFASLAKSANRMIDESDKYRKARRESEEKFKNLFDTMKSGVAVYKPVDGGNDFVITDFNKAAEKIENIKKDAIINMRVTEVFPGVSDFGLLDVFKRVWKTGNPEHHPIKMYHDDRIVGWRENYVYRLHTGEVVAVYDDMTEKVHAEEEKQKLQEQIARAHKMEAIGTLAGGIAHDFNNIIGIILGNAELAMDDVPQWSEVRHNLEEIKTASMRAKDVVRQLLSFARKQEQEQKPILLSPIVKESLKLLRATIPASIDIRQNIQEDCYTIMADPTQIHRVLINLCQNAAHAMDGSGVLEVNLKNVELTKDTGKEGFSLSAGKYVKLSITDTGQGIEEQHVERLFDPYFTTKEVGKGSGMGLAVVHGIIKDHNGAISVSSDPGKGSTFSIFFPKTDSEAIEENTDTDQISGGNETILVIDDDKSILAMLKGHLEFLGYSVTGKSDPIEAIELFKLDPHRFDMVITDMTMPRMTGDELALELFKIRPDLPVALCTGYSEKIDKDKSLEIGIKAYVEKPIDRSELTKTVRIVLGNGQNVSTPFQPKEQL